MHVNFFDLFSKMSVRDLFLKWGIRTKWLYFKHLKGFLIIIDITMAQKKGQRFFLVVKFYLKIVFSLTASVRGTGLFLWLLGKNWDFSGPAQMEFVKTNWKNYGGLRIYHKKRLRQCVTSMPARLKLRLKQQNFGI